MRRGDSDNLILTGFMGTGKSSVGRAAWAGSVSIHHFFVTYEQPMHADGAAFIPSDIDRGKAIRTTIIKFGNSSLGISYSFLNGLRRSSGAPRKGRYFCHL